MEYTPTEVIKIIKACREQGVSEFSLGELKLSFGAASEAVPPPPPNLPNPEAEAQAFAQHEADLKQERLEELKLSDPYEYEQLICMDRDGEEENSVGTQ